MDHESPYVEIFWTMKTAIKALQQVDPLANLRQTAIFRWKNILIEICDAKTILIGSQFFRNMMF